MIKTHAKDIQVNVLWIQRLYMSCQFDSVLVLCATICSWWAMVGWSRLRNARRNCSLLEHLSCFLVVFWTWFPLVEKTCVSWAVEILCPNPITEVTRKHLHVSPRWTNRVSHGRVYQRWTNQPCFEKMKKLKYTECAVYYLRCQNELLQRDSSVQCPGHCGSSLQRPIFD